MTTITFYSYKGGVGRTLAVANVAKYLSRFGQNVFLIDFDLEAPGLHYKLTLDDEEKRHQIKQGVADYIYAFAVEGKPPAPLGAHVIQIQTRPGSDGAIWMMPAGNVPSREYWRRLARLNWQDLLYADDAKGIPFFLELKERIEKEFAPHFLLIDARTGITEIGGVATTLLADKVVCLLLNNRENLEGAREVLRSIRNAPRLPGQSTVEMLPVLARIPEPRNREVEARILLDIRDYLNQEASDLSATLDITEVCVLHSEPDLELSESLRIGTTTRIEESVLLRDYLRLFARLIPRAVVEPYIQSLVEKVLERLLEDPEGVERDLEALAAAYPEPEVYSTLLKLYRVRGAKGKRLRAASRLWEITGKPEEPILWQIVQEEFEPFAPLREPPCSLDFVEAVWRAAGAADVEVGLKLSQTYSNLRQRKRAARLLQELFEEAGPSEAVTVAHLDALTDRAQWGAALEVIAKAKTALRDSGKFHAAWVRALLAKEGGEELRASCASGELSLEKVRDVAPDTYVEALLVGGFEDELDRFLPPWLEVVEPTYGVARVARLFRKAGRWDYFQFQVHKARGPDADHFLRSLQRYAHASFAGES